MNEAQRTELIDRLGRLLGMYGLTFSNASAEDRAKTLTLCLMAFRDLGAQEAANFIKENREDISQAMEFSAFAGDMQRDLDNLEVLEDDSETHNP